MTEPTLQERLHDHAGISMAPWARDVRKAADEIDRLTEQLRRINAASSAWADPAAAVHQPGDGLEVRRVRDLAATAAEALAEVERLREALLDAAANLAAAASAYRTYANRASHLGRVPKDALFTTRAADFDKSVERARAALGRTP